VDQQLKQLMKELGEAINGSLSDSEQIAEVVSRIKEGGYDIFLVLEATIGVSKQGETAPDKTLLVSTLSSNPELKISDQDLKFLKSLRIKLDDEDMDSSVSPLTLGLLPEARTRWGKFVFSYGVQSLVVTFFVIAAVLYPQVLVLPAHDFHFIGLVDIPAPIPQEPAKVRNFPTLKDAVIARAEALRVPAEIVRPKPPAVAEVEAPKLAQAPSKTMLPDAKPAIPKQLVQTNVFSTGSSAVPTMAAAPQKVQTGGFGDPNGVPAQDNHGRPVTIAQFGAYDMPGGQGYGNGTNGSRGARGVVASTGFGSGIATGDNSSAVSASRGTVREGGFGDADVVATTPRNKAVEPTVKTIPAEITYKPRPVYTEEGRRLKVEGEVLLDVIFTSTGQIKILGVRQGLGHGLDESAVRAAEKIQFKPALRDGHPTDFQAVLHIVFELAS
jgi:TonB family protein